MGRPSKFNQKLGDKICDQLIEGMSLKAICRQSGMPTFQTFFRWLQKEEHAAFRDQYAQARAFQQELKIDDTMEISESAADQLKDLPENVNQSAWINAQKMRIDAAHWAAERMAPKKYKPNFVPEANANDEMAKALNTLVQRLPD